MHSLGVCRRCSTRVSRGSGTLHGIAKRCDKPYKTEKRLVMAMKRKLDLYVAVVSLGSPKERRCRTTHQAIIAEEIGGRGLLVIWHAAAISKVERLRAYLRACVHRYYHTRIMFSSGKS
jgi:hypothetical protein